MNSLSLTLIVLSVVAASLHSNLQRDILKRGATSADVLVSQCAIGTIVCVAALFACRDIWASYEAHTPDPLLFWVAVGVTVIANVVIQWANVRARMLADVSFTSPISAMSPGLVVLTAAVLGEWPGLLGGIGVVIVMVGTYVHAREGMPLRTYFEPLFFWRTVCVEELSEHERRKYAGLSFAYLGALCSTVGLTFDGILPRYGNPALGVSIELAGLTVAYALYAVLSGQWRGWTARLRSVWQPVVFNGVCFGSVFVFLTIAFIESPIAYVAAMKRLGIFLSMVLAVWMFGELRGPRDAPVRRRRFALGSIIVGGALCIALDDTAPHVIATADELLRSNALALSVGTAVFVVAIALCARSVSRISRVT